MMSCYIAVLILFTFYVHVSANIHVFHNKELQEISVFIKKEENVIKLVKYGQEKYRCFQEKSLDQDVIEGDSRRLTLTERKAFLEQNNELIKECLDKMRTRRTKRSILQKIFPGTKWCGMGNIAANESDFGEEIETDKCCHDHDRCPEYIRSGERKYNFKNTLDFTLNLCNCDDSFYLCLKEADTPAAERVGKLFFNMIEMQCFMKEVMKTCVSWYIPLVWCKRYEYLPGVKVYNAQRWN